MRAANAVPIWQATIPANVIVVAWRYAWWSALPLADRVAGRPAAAQEHVEEPAEHEHGRDPAQEAPRADEHLARITPSERRPRRPVHQSRLGRLAAQRERGQRLRAQVDREDLQHRQRQRDRAAGEREDEERHDFGRRVGEDVEDELADVVVDLRPASTAATMRREVVVREHHGRRLAGHFRADQAHRDADVGAPQRRGVVDAVAGHRDDLVPWRAARPRCAASPRASCARRSARLAPQEQRRARARSSARARSPVTIAGRPARSRPARDLGRGRAVVAGDDDDPDPAAWQRATASATSGRGGSNSATSPRKHSSRLGVLAVARARRRAGSAPARHGEHTQTLAA